MKKKFTRLRGAGIAMLLTVATLVWVAPADASVPGKPFTQTHCEGDTDSVARLYSAGLGREAELGGFQFWVEEYVAGRWTLPRMAQFFVESPEFQASYGALDNAGFINQLYLNVHNRPADQGGLDFWEAQMQQGMTRATVLLRFSESPENITKTGTAQPTLGDYNEGRNTGAFHCGPDLSPQLLGTADLPDGGRAAQHQRWNDEACYAPLNVNSPATSVRYEYSDATFEHTLYHYPTSRGPAAYIAGLLLVLEECGTFTDASGTLVTMQSVDGPVYGDATVGILVTGVEPGGATWTNYHLATVVGNTVSVVNLSPGIGAFGVSLELYGALAAQKLIDAGF